MHVTLYSELIHKADLNKLDASWTNNSHTHTRHSIRKPVHVYFTLQVHSFFVIMLLKTYKTSTAECIRELVRWHRPRACVPKQVYHSLGSLQKQGIYRAQISQTFVLSWLIQIHYMFYLHCISLVYKMYNVIVHATLSSYSLHATLAVMEVK